MEQNKYDMDRPKESTGQRLKAGAGTGHIRMPLGAGPPNQE